MSSYMRMLNSSLLGNEKMRGLVVRNMGGYVMWEELSVNHFLKNTKNVLKWNRAIWLLFNIQSSD